jgi:hypothetical protein
MLTYGSEVGQISTADVKYVRRTASYSRSDYKNNSDVMKKLNTYPIMAFILCYKYKRKSPILRIPRSKIPIPHSPLPTGRTKIFVKILQTLVLDPNRPLGLKCGRLMILKRKEAT